MEVGSIARQQDVDQQRTRLHRMWGSVAPGWAEHADYADVRGAGATHALIERSGPRSGDRVLELACGAGGVGLAAAVRVGPGGAVVLSDVAPEMTAIAASRAAALGLVNVSARDLDLEAIDEPDASFDIVLCREGLMLALDPERASREIHRVLRPGGRVGLTVWGARERNPWLGVVFDAVSAQLGTPVPPPRVPGPFSLDDADRLEAILTTAGFDDVEVDELATPYRARSVDEWWTRTCALAGPLAQRLATLPEPAARALRDRSAQAIEAYATADGLDIPGVSLVASATRP